MESPKATKELEVKASTLSIDDLDISDVDVFGLTRDDALGVPELGASFATYGSCTACSPG
jgi:hypothetical protein